MQQWTVEDSVDLYGIRNWSTGYFDISPKGMATKERKEI